MCLSVYLPYSRYYKPGLYLFFSPLGAASIQEGLLFKRGLYLFIAINNAIKLIRKLKLQEIIISCLCHILLNNAHEINVMFVRRFSFAKIKKKFVLKVCKVILHCLISIKTFMCVHLDRTVRECQSHFTLL